MKKYIIYKIPKKNMEAIKLENVIEVRNLVKQYKELKAIDDLSFDVKKGEILGLNIAVPLVMSLRT